MKTFFILIATATLLVAIATTTAGQRCGEWYISTPDSLEFEVTPDSSGFCFRGVTGVSEERISLSRFLRGVYLSPSDSLGIWMEFSSPAKKVKISSSMENNTTGLSVVLANRFETSGGKILFPIFTSFLSKTLVIEIALLNIYPPALCPTTLKISQIALFHQGIWKRIDRQPDDLNNPGIPVAVESSSLQAPADFALYQNYPNPFNSSTTIRFSLPQAGEATLIIYNLQGQLVRELVSGYQSAGTHEVVWDGRDDFGQLVPSGIYFFKLTTADHLAVKKMNLLE